ncbi:MAG TPA: 4-(cytidine 5'-diphospho)-2-C-methyl-D-erythritol kinase, partial [Blastocatellia bacterium]|nr:4-(cytidine 5'-diphospho)-2-C-methyl-D-erythritol kinase [Blastocatellia bacterium]
MSQYPKAMTALSFTLPSFAKINLYLEVLGRRADGYHDISTIFQTVSLCDEISFTISPDLRLSCDDAAIPAGEENLIIRAARQLQAASGYSAGAQIHLTKRIPSPGGLGGGSSNA